MCHRLEDIEKVNINDGIHVPLFVGLNGKDNYGYLSDDTGDNISYKNDNYSEMTGFYWMCKNSDADIIGLCHYRRYFSKSFERLLSRKDIEEYLNDYDLIIPRRTKYIKGNLYENTSDVFLKNLESARDAIKKLCPEYLESFETMMTSSSLNYFNMFIGPKKLMQNYCDWIFAILDELEGKLDLTNPRWPGLLTEYLFNVWIEHNKLKTKEVNIKYKGTTLKLKKYIINNRIMRKLISPFYWKIIGK